MYSTPFGVSRDWGSEDDSFDGELEPPGPDLSDLLYSCLDACYAFTSFARTKHDMKKAPQAVRCPVPSEARTEPGQRPCTMAGRFCGTKPSWPWAEKNAMVG